MKKCTICTTTIFDLTKFLKAYYKNINEYGHLSDVSIIIAGDNKSPKNSKELVNEYRKIGLNVNFYDITEQKLFLNKLGKINEIIPENSDNRRNFAYIKAYESGSDFIISVDDDNFPIMENDFIGEHSIVGESVSLKSAIGKNGWYNLCSLLLPEKNNNQDVNLYPRGFPYKYKNDECILTSKEIEKKIGVNVGLWTGDPDTDAIGRLYGKPKIADYKKDNLLLADKTYSPINTQNTALSRDAMGAYYYVKMNERIEGLTIDRYGDIFSGYFLQYCVKVVGDGIKIGTPVCDHSRHNHNLFKDLYFELAGMMIIEDLVDIIKEIKLDNSSYFDAYESLSYQMYDYINKLEGFIWTKEAKLYFKMITDNMRIWIKTLKSI